MPKNAAATPKTSARASVMKKAAPMTAAQRQRKIAALCGEVLEFWKGKPSTGAVARLLHERRGKA
jgi:hypothetical protein